MEPPEFHPGTEAEFADDIDFYHERPHGLAVEFAEAGRAVTFIRTHPEVDTPVRGVLRRWRVRRFPYSIVHREEPQGIYVLALAHHRRRPEYWRDRR